MSTEQAPAGSSAAAQAASTSKRAGSDSAPASSRSRLNSPAHMTAARRHSLYGHDDRIVIDPGSRVWKVGFSGEVEPRACFWAPDFNDRTCAGEVWDLDLADTAGAHGVSAEARRLVQTRIERRLRDTFQKHLLTDGKQRKVVVVDNTFLPTYVKEFITATLFDNLKCPSVAFTPAPVLALAACGRSSGLVVDVGWLETTVTPVCFSRPLYAQARSSPVAGRAMYNRLRALLRRYARYLAPDDETAQPTPPPLTVLTPHVVERVLTEACYVPQSPPASHHSSQPGSSEPAPPVPDMDNDALMETLAARYAGADAADWTMALPPPRGVGRAGRLVVPGWVRARAAEVLFGDGPDEDATVPELVLRALQSVPVDVRGDMASSVLVTGGVACLPGFISRLRAEVYARIPTAAIQLEFGSKAGELASWKRRLTAPYAGLNGLAPRLAVLNDPAPLDGTSGGDKGGAAPRWAPSLVAWVGGSLAGALKTSAPELVREDYDARVTASMERGEAFRASVAAERDDLGAAMAAVGLDIDELTPGVPLAPLAPKRKRGWTVTGAVPDWTTARVRAGV